MDVSPDLDKAEKSIAKTAVHNPHFVVVICLMVIILGFLSLAILPKDLLPSGNFPAVQILTFYAGMPVEHVENDLTATFEIYTGQAIGIERQESKSILGVSIVKNYFNSSMDLNTALAQTTSLVMSALRRLPPGTQPPLILPFDPTSTVPLGLVAVSGDFPEKVLYDKARYSVRSAVQAVNGAMAPTVMGGSERQILIYLDDLKIKKYNFSLMDILRDITKLNTFIPSGDVKIGDYDYQLLSNGLVDKVTEMNDFPLRAQNGVPVYVKDVGEATDAKKIQTNVVRINGKRQVYVPVYRQPGANSLNIVDQVKEAIIKLEKTLGGIKLEFVADQSSFIRHAISSITEEALIGGSLAAVMVLLFLGNIRATFGILISLPLSILFSFIGLKATGQTINAMTLGGLAISIGVLVDNSIVVLENISKKLEEGMTVYRAAISGASEVSLPVLASTLSTLVVFFPVVFLSGIVQVLFSALAKSVMFAMIGSLLVATTVMPLFAANMLKTEAQTKKIKLLEITEGWIRRLTEGYGRVLKRVLKYKKQVLIGAVGVFAIGGVLAPHLGTELFPRADAGHFILELRGDSGKRIEVTEELSAKIESKLREWIDPHDLKMIITNAGVYYGFPAAYTPNSGSQDVFFHVELTEDRIKTSQEYAKIVREKLKQEFPTLDVGIELGGLLTSALNGGLRAPIDVQIQGPSIEKSHEIATSLANKFKSIKGAVDVRVQQRLDTPQLNIDVDRQKSMTLGLTTDEVVKNIVSAVSSSSSFNSSIWIDPKTGIDYLLGVQYPEGRIKTIDELNDIPITGPTQERSISLGQIAKISQIKGPSEVNHVNLNPVIDVFMDAEGRDIGNVSADVTKIIKAEKLPDNYFAEVRGEFALMNSAISSLGGGFLLSVILVYLILVIQFRSFSLPIIIMTTVPMGMVGIIVMLVSTNTYFSIQAAIGAIFMIGIAVANGVLLVEFISHKNNEMDNLQHAIVDGAKARLRPILMTSLASILGLVPMAIGLGHGSEANVPLGRAIIGGQLLSTTLTLFFIPVIYQFFAKSKKTIHAKGKHV